MPPLFSVIIPVYNRADTIHAVLLDVVRQSFRDYELLVVDDGSADNLKSAMGAFLDDHRIKYFHQENKGVSSARNYGALMASGNYLIFLDSDDSVEQNWLEEFYRLSQEGTIDVLCCSIAVIQGSETKIVTPEPQSILMHHRSVNYLAGSFAIKNEIFWQIGGYTSSLKFGENTELFIKLFQQVPACTVQSSRKPLFKYIVHPKPGDAVVRNKIFYSFYLLKTYDSIFVKHKERLANELYLLSFNLYKINKVNFAKRMTLHCLRIRPLNLKYHYFYFRITLLRDLKSYFESHRINFVSQLRKQTARVLRKVSSFKYSSYRDYFRHESLVVKYWDNEANWGDAVNPYIFNRVTGMKIVSYNRIFNLLDRDVFLGIGSIISGNINNYVIWGSGFISENTRFHGVPRKVLAVRGKLTKSILEKRGIKVPHLMGDPALLFPDYYNLTSKKKYKIGIVPHYKENQLPLLKSIKDKFGDEVRLIDMTEGITEVASAILECEIILSSSLHGLTLAEAYGIPTCRLVLSDRLIGGDFKFCDYYSGVGINTFDTLKLTDVPTSMNDLVRSTSTKDLKFDKVNIKNTIREYLQIGGL